MLQLCCILKGKQMKANSSLLNWLRKRAIRQHMMDRAEPYRNRPYPELMWCHPDYGIENFGCRREELVPQRDTLFSDIAVFLLEDQSVQDLYSSFWAQTKFHTQAWNHYPPTVQTLGHLPTGGITRWFWLSWATGVPSCDIRELMSSGEVGWASFFQGCMHAANHFGAFRQLIADVL